MAVLIEVVDDQAAAFAGFVYNVAGLSRHPWTKRGPLVDVPDEIMAEAGTLGSLYKLSFTKDPVIEAQEIKLPQPHQEFIGRLRQLHDALWRKYQDPMAFTKTNLITFMAIYGDGLPLLIAKQTGCAWAFERVHVVPSLYAGGTVTGPSVFVGFKRSDRDIKTTWPVVIHELVHVNTNPTKGELTDSLNLATDANEVTTVLLTNRIIAAINRRQEDQLPFNQFSTYYHQFIERWHDEFKAIEAQNMNYRDILLAVDEFFVQRGYKGYFKRYGT